MSIPGRALTSADMSAGPARDTTDDSLPDIGSRFSCENAVMISWAAAWGPGQRSKRYLSLNERRVLGRTSLAGACLAGFSIGAMISPWT